MSIRASATPAPTSRRTRSSTSSKESPISCCTIGNSPCGWSGGSFTGSPGGLSRELVEEGVLRLSVVTMRRLTGRALRFYSSKSNRYWRRDAKRVAGIAAGGHLDAGFRAGKRLPVRLSFTGCLARRRAAPAQGRLSTPEAPASPRCPPPPQGAPPAPPSTSVTSWGPAIGAEIWRAPPPPPPPPPQVPPAEPPPPAPPRTEIVPVPVTVPALASMKNDPPAPAPPGLALAAERNIPPAPPWSETSPSRRMEAEALPVKRMAPPPPPPPPPGPLLELALPPPPPPPPVLPSRTPNPPPALEKVPALSEPPRPPFPPPPPPPAASPGVGERKRIPPPGAPAPPVEEVAPLPPPEVVASPALWPAWPADAPPPPQLNPPQKLLPPPPPPPPPPAPEEPSPPSPVVVMLPSEKAPGAFRPSPTSTAPASRLKEPRLRVSPTAASARAVTVPARRVSEVKVCALPIAYRW